MKVTRTARAGIPPRGAGLLLVAFLCAFSAACGGPPAALDVSRDLDEPAVYRVGVTAESRFSGPVSDLGGATELTAAFEVTPASESVAEVEALYVAASVEDARGEPVSLGLGDLAGKRATVELRPPGVVVGVRGDEELLEAPVPLVSVRETVHALFPPLPGEELRPGDTWTGDVPVPFANLDGPGQRMRYVLQNAGEDAGRVEGYELDVGPRSFVAEPAGGRLEGEGDLEVEFRGELAAGSGYGRTERTARFASDFLRLAGTGTYANGNLRLESTTTVERLNAFEQFGLDAGA